MNRLLLGKITFVGFVILLIGYVALTPPTDSEVENGSNRTAERLEENSALLEATSDVTSPSDRQSAEKHFTAGDGHYFDNNYYDAIAEFNEAIQLYPQYSEAFLERGRAFHLLDQPNRAIENYNEVIRLTPDHQKAFVFRADSYNRLCRSMDAIAD